jgi:O-antigen ligase
VPRPVGLSTSGLQRAADWAWGGWVGPALAFAFAWWPVAAHGPSRETVAFTAAVLVSLVAWAAGRLLARVVPTAVGLGMAVVVGAALLPVVASFSLDSPVAPPLGYANANAALITATVAALIGTWHVVDGQWNRAWVLGAATAFALLALLTQSVAGSCSCLLLLLVSRWLHRGRQVWWQVASLVVLLGSLAFITLVGLASKGGTPPSVVTMSFGLARPALWGDALSAAWEHPISGLGPGGFRELSPVAADPDTAWAHSAPLQILAETGFVGLLFFLALLVSLVRLLGRSSAVLAALGLQPMVDYVLHFPIVIFSFSLVLGASSVLLIHPHRTELPVVDQRDQVG